MEHLYGGFKPPVVDFHDAEVDSGRSKDLSICVSEPGDGVRTFRLGSILDEGFHDKLPAPRSPLSSAPEALLRELFRREYDIHDLQVVGADLEEAFLDLTRHAEKETVA